LSTEIFRKWLAHYDPVHRGRTRTGLATGLSITHGFSFPRIRGAYHLYRTDVATAPLLVGITCPDDSTIRTLTWLDDPPGTQRVYRLVPVSGGGVENWVDVTYVAVYFTSAGWWIGSLPNAPSDLQLIPLSYGRFSVRWSYYPHDQQVAPAGFRLYSSGTGTAIDYGAVQASVPYRPGLIHYEYITRPRPDGQRLGWAVRAYAASGHEEQNLDCVYALTRAVGPPANPVVQIRVVPARQS